MNPEQLESPIDFLRRMLPGLHPGEDLRTYHGWWEEKGDAVSAAVDRAGTPWLRMFDPFGARIDEILMPAGYRELLLAGYRAGAVWKGFEGGSLLPAFLLGYVTSFHDPGLYCPHTVSLSTAVPVAKYAPEAVRERLLPRLLARDDGVWQGATWMTEAAGGSDLGANVVTVARPQGDRWLLTGEKYFASNVGAELAVVAARPEGAPQTVRGLALFLVPQRREDGKLSYHIRRLKDKIGTRSVPTGEVELRDSAAWLLGREEWGIYLILEVLNLSRVANAIGCSALAQRTVRDALRFARKRRAFGRPVAEHPLMRRQFEERRAGLERSLALAWEAATLLDEVWRETPPYSERHALFRLVAHLAKYRTAEFAVQTAKWGMEVQGGMGVLAEFGAERWFREGMVLAIWEGTSHRQILDGLEVMERRGAHRALLEHLAADGDAGEVQGMGRRLEDLLALPPEEREAGAEGVFGDLADLTARVLVERRRKAGAAAGA